MKNADDVVSASLISQSEVFNKQLRENEAHTFEEWMPIYSMALCTLPHLSVSAKQYVSARLLLRSVDICISMKAKKHANAVKNEAVMYEKAQIGMWPALLKIPEWQRRKVGWKALEQEFSEVHNSFQAAYDTRQIDETKDLGKRLAALHVFLLYKVIPRFEEFAPDRPPTASGHELYEDGVRKGSSPHVRPTSRKLAAHNPQILQPHVRRKERQAQTPSSGRTQPHEDDSQRRYLARIARFFRGLRTRARPSHPVRSARRS